MFLGFSPSVTNFSPSGTEFSLVFDSNPLIEFVELPDGHSNLLYSNILAGAIRGALQNVQLDVSCHFVQDQLRGDPNTEIRVKFNRRIEEITTGED
ncbi:UNVERIFIED_CONTAM: hypothetical protein GTU68_022659 [Idotea baltica]|nr:hypothetical protein [Idotea baltica]